MIDRVNGRLMGIKCAAAGGTMFVLLAAAPSFSHAQVVLDGKFGTSGPLGGPNYNITAGLGATRGNNLFHSFSQFDLKSGDVATFSGPANIQNILSRVTGGSPSSIDGTIRSSIAGANFFFINPSGVVFGPNAAVDVSGSFTVSTANYLKLADGARFVAALDADDSMLSTEPVVAFGFLDGASGSMEVRGSLKAATGKTLSVVATTVSVGEGARLEAIDGQINLTGVSAAGEVALSSSSPASGTTVTPFKSNVTPIGADAGSGNVVIRGGRLVVENAQINANATGGNLDIALTQGLEVKNGGTILTSSAGAIRGGNIVISSPSVIVDGQDGSAATRIAAETASDDPLAAGGNIIVHSDSVEASRGAEISVSTFGTADAGRLDITTSSLRLRGSDAPQFPTQISANAAPVIGTATGAGGQIAIRANSVEVENGAAIQAVTTGDANAGSIDINASSLTLKNGAISTYSAGAGSGGEIHVHSDNLTLDGPFTSITALTTGGGSGGLINIDAGSLRVRNSAAISASTYGAGQGGDINITANSIVLDTAKSQAFSTPGISAASKPSFFGEAEGGKGGDISIKTGLLTLLGGMSISTTTETIGDGGNININAWSVTLDGQSSIQSASTGTGRAGTISVTSARNVILNDRSTISTSAPLSSGGNIEVRAGGDIQLFGSKITAQAGPSGGGSVMLQAPSLIYLLDSTLTAQAVGDGGNLTIVDPAFFILNRGALVSKSSSANGGNITILSDYFFQSSSIIDASAPFGLPGTVSVSAPQVDLSGSLIGLPSNLLDVESQLRPDCGVRSSETISSFIVLGRGGLPLEPGGLVPSGSVRPLDEKK